MHNLQSGSDEGDVRAEVPDDILTNSSESTMPYAGYHLAYPELVNSHLFLLLANHIRSVEGYSEAGDGVKIGDGVGECQEKITTRRVYFTVLRTFKGRIRLLWDASHRIS